MSTAALILARLVLSLYPSHLYKYGPGLDTNLYSSLLVSELCMVDVVEAEFYKIKGLHV